MRRPLLTALILSVAGAAPLGAQQARADQCVFNPDALPTTRVAFERTPAGFDILFVGGGVRVDCPGRGTTLLSDSAEYYGDRDVWNLIGSVRYRDARATLDSRRATYWVAEERLLAEQDVVARLPNGSTMRGPQAEYFRAVPGVRARSRLVAPGRPNFELVQTDTVGAPEEPVMLVADRVVSEDDSLVSASGRVVIERSDFIARADSVRMDRGEEWMRLMRIPSIEGRGERPFTLTGAVIDLYSRERKLEHVVSRVAARAVSDDLDLRSDTIDLRLANDMLQRAQAWGASRARAVSENREIIADSLDVLLPGQRIREVRAVGGAEAHSAPDTLVIRTSERDQLFGDLIVALFDTVPSVLADTTQADEAPPIRELTADGNARSLYHLETAGQPPERPSINYVRGRRIVVQFGEGEVRTVSVVGQADGVLLQPAASEDPATGEPAEPAAPSETRPVEPVRQPPAPPASPDTASRTPSSRTPSSLPPASPTS